MHFETGRDLLGALLSATLDGLLPDHVATLPARLAAVSRSDAAQAAMEHLNPAVVAIVGPAQQVRPLLEKSGFAPVGVVLYTDPIGK